MSKQSEAKQNQGYNPKPPIRACMSCKHYLSDIKPMPTVYGSTYEVENNKRCGIGGFAVKKTACCNIFERRHET